MWFNINMSWATSRRTFILSIIASFFIAIIALVLISVLYKSPSCSDNIQNQNEVGVDCGGVCPYLCSMQIKEPTVRFVSMLQNVGNRIDAIAYVDNSNTNAAVINAPYKIELYGADAKQIAQYKGVVDLPPHGEVPIFVPNIYDGTKHIVNSFLSFSTTSMRWFTANKSPQVLPYTNIKIIGTTTPRITATLANPTGSDVTNVKVIIAVFGASGNVIGASQTLVHRIPAEENVQIVFTWNKPFPSLPVKEEIWPIMPITPS